MNDLLNWKIFRMFVLLFYYTIPGIRQHIKKSNIK